MWVRLCVVESNKERVGRWWCSTSISMSGGRRLSLEVMDTRRVQAELDRMLQGVLEGAHGRCTPSDTSRGKF